MLQRRQFPEQNIKLLAKANISLTSYSLFDETISENERLASRRLQHARQHINQSGLSSTIMTK